MIAPNIPKKPYLNVPIITKEAGELKLVYLSLINEHKNLLLLLQLISNIKSRISLDIFGPVVDEMYWNRCKGLIEKMPEKVHYKGVIEPSRVQEVLSQYHVFILFTKGENFGHAIYESLSVGRPVITSHFTPWKNLSNQRAGANVDFENLNETIEKMNLFVALPQHEYNLFCSSALEMATSYYSELEAEKKYVELFS
jgi:glycosyltransferase involved in cell wall biosynthesis